MQKQFTLRYRRSGAFCKKVKHLAPPLLPLSFTWFKLIFSSDILGSKPVILDTVFTSLASLVQVARVDLLLFYRSCIFVFQLSTLSAQIENSSPTNNQHRLNTNSTHNKINSTQTQHRLNTECYRFMKNSNHSNTNSTKIQHIINTNSTHTNTNSTHTNANSTQTQC